VLPEWASRLAAEVSPELAQQIGALERMAAAGAEGLVVVDTHGCCVLVNGLAALLSGSTEADQQTLSVGEYFSRLVQRHRLIDDAGSAIHNVEDIAALALSRRRLHFISSAGHNSFPTHEQRYTLTTYPLYTGPGTLIGYALFVRDISPLVHDEPLENGLLSSVSHDLRTPLMVIKAAVTGLLQEGLQWDEALRRETLQDINEETDRLTTLVSALLEMSRIEGGALRLQTEWCDLAEIIHTVLDRLQKVTRRHRMVYDVAAPLPLIRGDFMQLDRVLSNLIENAVKYAPEGTEVRVTASLAGAEVQVSVLDQGCGVPPEEGERIFEKFYRVRQRRPCPTRSEGWDAGSSGQRMPSLAGGSGLGLAICRGIIQAHHGRIWVETRAEGGSRFVFTLPVEQSAPMTGEVAHDSGPFGEFAKPQPSPDQETSPGGVSAAGEREGEETDETA
jgi:signal transduction histidine kinase